MNYFDEPPKKMVGINLIFLEKNKINITVNHKKDFFLYVDKFRRQNENINLSLIIHNYQKKKIILIHSIEHFLKQNLNNVL
ncbi:hypothetical protein RRG50_05120 [Mycoplasmopsis felis]|uniref:hypothetical protein n=1 Tax=Mycoplasmopsis felis TaxID=33923 RepID=UPI002AFEF706|nr:hypothetical protein [Mycoplasmopsis felis]WQQ10888.1 hypothetical protein RRG45_03935 [Mycoplasmopsis felis]